MHHYVRRLCSDIGCLAEAEAGDQAATEARLRAAGLNAWSSICGIANSGSYCGQEWRWLAALAARIKAELRPPQPPKPQPTWKSEPATEKQIAALARLGYRGDAAKLTKGEASRLLYRAKRNSEKVDELREYADEVDGLRGDIALDLAADINNHLFGYHD